jgi:5-methylcytosine-specific restriction endonuclease McrA
VSMAWKKTREDRRQDARTYGARWRHARDAHLRKTGWQCEIRMEGVCIGSATEVDHVHGAENDPGHRFLRAACEPCHAKVTAQQGGGYRKGPADPQPRQGTVW